MEGSDTVAAQLLLQLPIVLYYYHTTLDSRTSFLVSAIISYQ